MTRKGCAFECFLLCRSVGALVLLLCFSGGCQKPLFGTGDSKQKPKTKAKSDSQRAAEKEPDQIEDRPATPKTMYAYARILFAQGQDGACDQLLAKIIAENPRLQPAYLLQAEVRMRAHRVDDAMVTLYSALRLFPRDDVILNDLGICFLMKSDCKNALAAFTAAAGLQPWNGRYRANMALSLGLMAREEESMSLYAMVLPPKDAQHNLSVVTSARGSYWGAAEATPQVLPGITTPQEPPTPLDRVQVNRPARVQD